MFDRSSKKLGLDQAVLSRINNKMQTAHAETTGDKTVDLTESDHNAAVMSDSGMQKMDAIDKKAIDALLKYGAYDLFNKEDDDANRFCEEDIDK